VTELRPEVPAAVAHLVASCLDKQPSRRPQSADEVLLALEGAASQPLADSPPRARRFALAISTIVLVAGAALAYYALVPRGSERLKTAGTTNAAALDLFRIGQDQLRQRRIAGAIQSFQGAIDLDSNYARAHAALATALGLVPFFIDGPPAAPIARSMAEASRALAIDSTLADAYVARGAAHGYAGQWDASNSDMRRAIALEPDNAMARQTFARHLIVRGHATEGLEQLERALKVDATSPLISGWLAYAFFLDGHPDSALAQSERTIKLGPMLGATVNLGALLNLGLGRKNEARRLSALAIPGMFNAPYVYAKLGDSAAANRLLREMDARNPRPWFVDVAKASVLLATGDSAGALTALEKSSGDTGALWVFYIPLGDPAFDLVRKSERFAALLHRANIDSRVVMNPRRGN
jgi:tetratricopeptide (TPR) repeat protein